MNEIEIKMQKSITNLESRLTSIRAGRANPAMLNGVLVDSYGTLVPLQTLANILVPDAHHLLIKPFVKNTLKEIERALNEANLGIPPVNNGEMITMTIPELTEERRREYVKQAKVLGEEAKVALRNIRQEANNNIKREAYPEDEEKLLLDEVQELINQYNKVVDTKMKTKETELMQI